MGGGSKVICFEILGQYFKIGLINCFMTIKDCFMTMKEGSQVYKLIEKDDHRTDDNDNDDENDDDAKESGG